MTTKLEANGATLPWSAITRDGYAKFDLSHRDVSGTFEIVRSRPDDQPPGVFIAWHNGNRISDRYHANRIDAVAEAERYYYGLPINAASAGGKLINVGLEMGRNAQRDGASIYTNPFPGDKPVERAQWAEGWLQAYGGAVSAKLINALSATTQANNALEADNAYLINVARTLKIAIKYATTEVIGDGPEGMAFLSEWLASDDADKFAADHPDWIVFRDAAIAEVVASIKASHQTDKGLN